MDITYSAAAKTARMAAVIGLIDAGAGPGVLEIGTSGMASVLATLPLADPCGTAAAGVLTFDMDPAIEDAAADASGKPGGFRLKDSDGTTVVTGVAAGPWLPTAAYVAGEYATNDGGKLYRCTAPGTSAGSGGPTGTTGSISDGTVTWEWVKSSGWGMALDSALITKDQKVTLSAGSISHAPDA
jgi:hypothetical protein